MGLSSNSFWSIARGTDFAIARPPSFVPTTACKATGFMIRPCFSLAKMVAMPDLIGQWVAAEVSVLISGNAKHSNDYPPTSCNAHFDVTGMTRRTACLVVEQSGRAGSSDFGHVLEAMKRAVLGLGKVDGVVGRD